MKVGNMVLRKPITISNEKQPVGAAMKGRVVYIHPKNRFHTVEFTLAGGTVRESFLGVPHIKKFEELGR